MPIKRKLKIIGAITGLVVITCLAIILLNSKAIELSKQDRIYIRRFLNDWHINKTPNEVHKNFESEVNFISVVQDSVIASITGEQIPHAYFGNIAFYYHNRQGICYDRAVLLEKIMLLYHFRFRHVYMYFGKEKSSGRSDFFNRYLKSHAALEVKTKKGWMGIGTDANWLGIGKNQQVLNYFDVRNELKATKGDPSWQKTVTIGGGVWKTAGYNFRIIYGIYSRHGDFFTGASEMNATSLFTNKHHFLPDYNLRMLIYNL